MPEPIKTKQQARYLRYQIWQARSVWTHTTQLWRRAQDELTNKTAIEAFRRIYVSQLKVPDKKKIKWSNAPYRYYYD